MSVQFGSAYSTRVLTSLRTYLAADSTFAGFFGRSAIRVHWGNRLAVPVRAPYLAIVPSPIKDVPQSAYWAKADLGIDFEIWLPPSIPENPEITPPGKPAISVANGSGALSGVYRWALTAMTLSGESFSSVLSDPQTLASGKATITIPTGGGIIWRRLWRTEAGLTCPRIRAFCIPDGVTSFVDEAPDSALGDEIHPDQGLVHELDQLLRAFLESHRCVHDSDTDRILTEAGMTVEDTVQEVRPARNQEVFRIRATWQVRFDRTTRGSILE